MLHPALIELERTFQPAVISKIGDPFLQDRHIELWLKRDDLLHPVISGNKWRKLKYILNHALNRGADTLVSMGGAYSNHLHALAYAGQRLGLKTVGYIRGEPEHGLTPTLTDVVNWGMTLRFVSRSDYRELRHYQSWCDLPGLLSGQYWLPEGGAHLLALQGIAELVEETTLESDFWCVPCGTGTTLAGLIKALPRQVRVLGFAALKQNGFLAEDVKKLTGNNHDNWQIMSDYHGGGFAKTHSELRSFITGFQQRTGVELEPVYTGKMLYGLYDLASKDFFKPGQRIMALHTGGLQGNRGFQRA